MARAVEPRADDAPREVTLTGEVIFVSRLFEDRKIKADLAPIKDQVALRGADGSVTPLVSDEASRALFLDHRLRERKAELTGWMYPGLPYLQVVRFRVDDQGALKTPEYYCDVCTITVRYPQVCPCCQGEMELRYRSAS
jgi:hypothetical protein